MTVNNFKLPVTCYPWTEKGWSLVFRFIQIVLIVTLPRTVFSKTFNQFLGSTHTLLSSIPWLKEEKNVYISSIIVNIFIKNCQIYTILNTIQCDGHNYFILFWKHVGTFHVKVVIWFVHRRDLELNIGNCWSFSPPPPSNYMLITFLESSSM